MRHTIAMLLGCALIVNGLYLGAEFGGSIYEAKTWLCIAIILTGLCAVAAGALAYSWEKYDARQDD